MTLLLRANGSTSCTPIVIYLRAISFDKNRDSFEFALFYVVKSASVELGENYRWLFDSILNSALGDSTDPAGHIHERSMNLLRVTVTRTPGRTITTEIMVFPQRLHAPSVRDGGML